MRIYCIPSRSAGLVGGRRHAVYPCKYHRSDISNHLHLLHFPTSLLSFLFFSSSSSSRVFSHVHSRKPVFEDRCCLMRFIAKTSNYSKYGKRDKRSIFRRWDVNRDCLIFWKLLFNFLRERHCYMEYSAWITFYSNCYQVDVISNFFLLRMIL